MLGAWLPTSCQYPGILTVSGIPEYTEKREALLGLAEPLARLPAPVLAGLEDPESTYNFGWSHGKEKFQGKPDLNKGSYYANPTMNVPTTDSELIQQHPANCRPNLWPSHEDLPGFEGAFMGLGRLVADVGLLVAAQCDRLLLRTYPSAYRPHRLEDLIRHSRAHKARLLHYFPPNEAPKGSNTQEGDSEEDWCGWHLDHGSITGLCSALYTKASYLHFLYVFCFVPILWLVVSSCLLSPLFFVLFSVLPSLLIL